MTVVALVLAGGRGERAGLGRNKALAAVDGTSLVSRSVVALRPHVDRVVVVARRGDLADLAAEVAGLADEVVPGGITRHGSEVAGLGSLPARDAEVVAVHDAARPLVGARVVTDALAPVRSGTAVAAVPGVGRAVPLARPRGDGTAVLVPREGVVGVQTPQVALAARLRAAFALVTDPSAMRDTVEPLLLHHPDDRVVLTAGDPANLKVTWPGDLARAEAVAAGEVAPPGLRHGGADPDLPGRVHVAGARPTSDALRRVAPDGRVVGALDRTGLVDLVGTVTAGPGVLDAALVATDPGRAVERAVAAGATLTLDVDRGSTR